MNKIKFELGETVDIEGKVGIFRGYGKSADALIEYDLGYHNGNNHSLLDYEGNLLKPPTNNSCKWITLNKVKKIKNEFKFLM